MSDAILLTGGSGVVGSAVLERLRGRNVIALQRNRPIPTDCSERVRGDIVAPMLGLDAAAYEALRRRVGTVVHCAATVDVGRADVDHMTANAAGTATMLQFAKDAGASFVYMSTAYVHEGISDVEYASGYEPSKIAAEAQVRASGLPVTIVRPSIVVGDTESGVMPEHQGLHLVLIGIVEGTVPVLPGHATAYVDFVPRDHLAAVVAALVDKAPESWPADVWVTRGAAAMPLHEFAATAHRFATSLGGDRPQVTCVPYERIERLFLPVFMSALPAGKQRQFRRLLRLARYMNVVNPLADSAELLTELGIPELPDNATVLTRNLAAWSSRAAAVTPEPAL